MCNLLLKVNFRKYIFIKKSIYNLKKCKKDVIVYMRQGDKSVFCSCLQQNV